MQNTHLTLDRKQRNTVFDALLAQIRKQTADSEEMIDFVQAPKIEVISIEDAHCTILCLKDSLEIFDLIEGDKLTNNPFVLKYIAKARKIVSTELASI